eukprot:676609-Pleurochrysis_carterae.AAC.1
MRRLRSAPRSFRVPASPRARCVRRSRCTLPARALPSRASSSRCRWGRAALTRSARCSAASPQAATRRANTPQASRSSPKLLPAYQTDSHLPRNAYPPIKLAPTSDPPVRDPPLQDPPRQSPHARLISASRSFKMPLRLVLAATSAADLPGCFASVSTVLAMALETRLLRRSVACTRSSGVGAMICAVAYLPGQ